MTTIEKLREKLNGLLAQATAIQNVADAESRVLTSEESQTLEGIQAAFDETDAELKRRERTAAQEQRLQAASGRVAQPEPTATPMPAAATSTSTRPAITGGLPAASAAMPGTGGFRSYGEYALSVKAAATGGGVDPRLRVLNAAATTQAQEGVGADGGYQVPPDFRTQILQRVMSEEELLGRCDTQPTASNAVNMTVDEDSPWETSSGIQVYWEGEGTPYGQSKPALRSVMVRTNKIAALVPVTDELLEDAPSIESFLRQKVPIKMAFKVNDAILNGDGVGKPLGILKAPCLVTQAAEGSQTATTINFANITKMWSRMPERNRRTAVWIINQDAEPQLDALTVPSGTPAMPAYLPAGGLSGAPYATLKGRPVIYSEATAAIGTPGDIILADLGCYFAPVKSTGLRADSSIHLWFDQGLTAFRFTMRIGGQCWWSAPITRPGGKNTQSCFVALASR